MNVNRNHTEVKGIQSTPLVRDLMPAGKENKHVFLVGLVSNIISYFKSLGSLAFNCLRACASFSGRIKRAVFTSNEKVNKVATENKIIHRSAPSFGNPAPVEEIVQVDISPDFKEPQDEDKSLKSIEEKIITVNNPPLKNFHPEDHPKEGWLLERRIATRYDDHAEKGDVEAMFELANVYTGYLDEYTQEKVQDYPRAFIWFTKAAERGHVKSMHALGNLYYQNEQFKDQKLGFEWLEKASEKGHVESMMNLGSYYSGEGEWKDLKKAFDQYSKAANAGSKEAMFQIGYMYLQGLGVEENIDLAKEWLTKADKAGNLAAIYILRGLSKS